jgi:hypothetical protein
MCPDYYMLHDYCRDAEHILGNYPYVCQVVVLRIWTR